MTTTKDRGDCWLLSHIIQPINPHHDDAYIVNVQCVTNLTTNDVVNWNVFFFCFIVIVFFSVRGFVFLYRIQSPTIRNPFTKKHSVCQVIVWLFECVLGLYFRRWQLTMLCFNSFTPFPASCCSHIYLYVLHHSSRVPVSGHTQETPSSTIGRIEANLPKIHHGPLADTGEKERKKEPRQMF